MEGPGGAPLEAARAELGALALIAEDLGVITPPGEDLRRRLGLPGMEALRFLFDAPREGEDAVEAVGEDRVMYTGTHDHDTVLGWWRSLDAARRAGA